MVTGKHNGGVTNKAALEATRITVSFFVNELRGNGNGNGKENNDNVNIPLSVVDTNGVVYELQVLVKTGSDSRSYIAKAGAILLLDRFLNAKENLSLQANTVMTTTMKVFSLSGVATYKKRLGRKTRVVIRLWGWQRVGQRGQGGTRWRRC